MSDETDPAEALAAPHGGIDRDMPLPLFLQIRQKLLALITDWPDPERRFHTDAELAERFGVTKATVRHALSELAAAGLIRRRRGSGTFVLRPRFLEKLSPSLDIDRQYAGSGAGISTRVLAFERRPATAPEARALRLEPGHPVVAMRRLRQLAHVPLAIDERVLEAGLAARAGFTEASAAAPIVDRLRREVPLGRASWEMQARLAGPLDAALLQISPDDPVLVRAMLYEGEDGTPLMLGETCHRSDMVRCGFDMDMRAGEGRAEMRDWTAETFPEAPAAGLAARPDRAQ